MGNIVSKPEDPGALYLKDQMRFSISSVTIFSSRQIVLLSITPNTFPATRVTAKRDRGDDAPVEYIQDPESLNSNGPPSFLLRLNNDDELNFHFVFSIQQTQPPQAAASTASNGVTGSLPALVDTVLNGLTFAQASNWKELDNLVTREFHANPNLQNNANVQHVGRFSTDGNHSAQFEWMWKWKPPRAAEDKGGGWRNCCSFLDYDQRANRLNNLASFSFWVHNSSRPLSSPQVQSPQFELTVPPRYRVASSHSVQSRISETEAPADLQSQQMHQQPATPPESTDIPLSFAPSFATQGAVKLDITCHRPGDDMCAVEDGPLFRATMKALEQKTGNMRTKIKKVIKRAEAVHQAQGVCNESVSAFINALNDASTSNANAVLPALEHYFEKIARQILQYEQQNTAHLHKLIIEPLSKLYQNDIKQAEAKKKDFDDESRDYYAYVGRYLGQRQDSLKEKKRAESDSKYQNKRRNFELKRFDYSSFLQDLHGGRKEQEVLSHLTKYADIQAKSFLSTAKTIEEMVPQLEALIHEVSQADKEFQFQRTEREEKRRALEISSNKYVEPDLAPNIIGPPPSTPGASNATYFPESDLGRADSTGSQLRTVHTNASALSTSPNASALGPSMSSASTNNSRFKGIRDLEERDMSNILGVDGAAGQQKKEGLLWALSRPGSHIDPKGINKQAWHKFWIVLDQGKLSEYSNWKQKLDLHMEPIDLRMASVREARNAERRFCFEVITPQFKRVYQATSEEDMRYWITAINNALQSAVEGRGLSSTPSLRETASNAPFQRDIGSILTGKSSSYAGPHGHSFHSTSTGGVNRRTTVGARPSYIRTDSNSYEENPAKFLQTIRDADQGNKWCADCGSSVKVEWCSINLGIVLCIECSGIHRSLGTHISKIRSLTLDIHSFSNDIVEILLQVGNRVSNMIWEAGLEPAQKPTPQSTREQRLRFITAKYSERAYIQPLSSHATPDDTLLASIKKNDIKGVLYGIALRANPNVTDRSRGTHAVFLALAAADPAAPGTPGTTITTTTAVTKSPTPPPPPPSAVKPIPFPIAELLVQNGAEIPTQLPTIPLTPAAQLYVSQRTGKASATFSSGGTFKRQTSTKQLSPSRSGDGDTLGALPIIRGHGGGVESGSLVSSPSLDNREREKLQKRGSAGARFAGKVASTLGGS